MQSLRSSRLLALAPAAVMLALPLVAESFEGHHTRDLAGNPGDLHFRLDTTGGRRSFHIGERIPITLEFSSDAPEKYKLNGATYDRSGRLPTEEFVLEQENVADPYQDYYDSGVLGWIGGGLRGYPVLNPKPYTIELNLNDWFRFDHPGRYRLYLKSHRLTRESLPGESGEKVVQLAAVSNIFEIEILADDAAWANAKLSEIRTVLDRPEPKQPGSPPDQDVAMAQQELRYLGTADAVRLAFEYARRTGQSPDAMLLIGARDRPRVIAAFDGYLADPRTGIREWDIRDRALFTLLQEGVLKPLPVFRWQLPASADLQNLQATADARQKHFEALVREEAIRLVPIVTRKEGAARKISSEAITSVAPDAAKAARLVPPDDYGLSREELIAQFPEFPPEQQSELLGKKWDLVRGPEMIPALRSIIEKAPSKSLADDAMALWVWGADEGITSSALQRLSELSPQETARILRSDIASGKPRFAAFAVRLFPAQDIPEADEALSNLLSTNPRGSLPLVAKFATARLADRMRARYIEPFLPCADEISFVSYFVRTLPEEGAGGGIELLRQAMANREERACYRRLLSEVSGVVWNSAIEKQAISTLNDSDAEAAMNAAEVLSANGRAEVEPLLWKRLEQWAERWRGRAAELEVHPITGDLPNPESELGVALFDAIATAQSWVLDEPRRQRLGGLCIDDECRTLWSRQEPSGEIQVEANNGGAVYPTGFHVGRYRVPTLEKLKGRLRQFPEGTEFRWCPEVLNPFDAFSPGQREEMFSELALFLSERSMSIHPYLEDRCVPGLAGRPKN